MSSMVVNVDALAIDLAAPVLVLDEVARFVPLASVPPDADREPWAAAGAPQLVQAGMGLRFADGVGLSSNQP